MVSRNVATLAKPPVCRVARFSRGLPDEARLLIDAAADDQLRAL